MRVAQVAVGAALGGAVAGLARDLQPLGVVANCARELAKEVARVAEVAARAPHSLPVA